MRPNVKSLWVDCAGVKRKNFLVTLARREKERSWVKAVHMDTIKGLCTSSMDKIPNERIRELCRLKLGKSKHLRLFSEGSGHQDKVDL